MQNVLTLLAEVDDELHIDLQILCLYDDEVEDEIDVDEADDELDD